MPIEQYANLAQTTLAADVTTTSTTSVTVTSSGPFPVIGTDGSNQFRVIVDSELLIVTAVSGTTWTVQRGAEGTTAATHTAGASVTQILTEGGLTNFSYPFPQTDSTPPYDATVFSGNTVTIDSSTPLVVASGNVVGIDSGGVLTFGATTVPAAGTPSLTLSTTNSAGSTGNYLDAGSTIAAFDATVPVTQASGDTAATGSATVAARRDHKHGMPTIPIAPNVQEFAASGTWTKPSGATVVEIMCIGAGSGGYGGIISTGSGRSSGSVGSIGLVKYLASDLPATLVITVGSGGSGGAGGTTTSNAGGIGGDTSAGIYCWGGGGSGNNDTASSNGFTSNADLTLKNETGGSGSGGTYSGAGQTGHVGCIMTGVTPASGGTYNGYLNANGSAGSNGAATAPWGNGGGGGGGANGGSSIVVTGGKGGNGSNYGGAGGGGGNVSGASGSIGGAGGNGANGYCRVITW